MKSVSSPDPRESLYKKTIMFYYRSMEHRKVLANPSLESQQVNRSCGDRVKLQFIIDNSGIIQETAYQGEGCSVCIASAAMLCEAIQNFTLAQGAALAENLVGMLETTDDQSAQEFCNIIKESLGEESPLLALRSIRNFGSRVPCAVLSWNILPKLLENTAP